MCRTRAFTNTQVNLMHDIPIHIENLMLVWKAFRSSLDIVQHVEVVQHDHAFGQSEDVFLLAFEHIKWHRCTLVSILE